MPRFNYTGRKKIKRQDIIITIFNSNGILSYDADVDLTDYTLPSEAPVYVEAYRQTSWMRFEHGTVSSLKSQSNNRLSEFDSLDGIRFRVKVSQGDGVHGSKPPILAMRLVPQSSADQQRRGSAVRVLRLVSHHSYTRSGRTRASHRGAQIRRPRQA